MICNAGDLSPTKQMPLGCGQQRPVLCQNLLIKASNRETGIIAVVSLPEQKAAAVAAEAALTVRRCRVHLERRLGRELDCGFGELVGAKDERSGVFAALLALTCRRLGLYLRRLGQ